jgi:hypothetical protein
VMGGAAMTSAQEIPADYVALMKVNIPRNDLTVAFDGTLVPTPLGCGGWIALAKGDHNMDVMMGDLVLAESEVNPVMSAVLTPVWTSPPSIIKITIGRADIDLREHGSRRAWVSTPGQPSRAPPRRPWSPGTSR